MASKEGINDIRTWGPDRSTVSHLPQSSTPGLPVAAAEIIYQGCLVAYDTAASEALSAITTQADTAKVVGIAAATVDNRTGAKGALKVEVYSGLVRLVNDGNVTAAHLFRTVRVIDDHTVGVAAGTNADRAAGLLVALDSTTHCWVLVTPETALRSPVSATLASTNGTAAAAIPGALTSAQVATADGSDAATTQALANALKTAYNQLQVDVAAIRTAALAAAAEAEKAADDTRALHAALVTAGIVAPAA